MFRARGESGWMDDGNGLLFTGSEFQFPELRLTLPATADPSPPVPDLRPRLKGAGACFFEGVANCALGERPEGAVMRRLSLGVLFSAVAWSQAIPIDCGQAASVVFSPTVSRVNLSFPGQQGETVFFRFITVTRDVQFRI